MPSKNIEFANNILVGSYRFYCEICKDKIVSFLDELSLQVSEQQIAVTETIALTTNHETQN